MTNSQDQTSLQAKNNPTDDPMKTDLKYEFGRLLNLSWFKPFHCIRFRTVYNLPHKGPMIIAPNHVSYYDPPIIAAGMPFKVRFMAWDALFRVPILRGIMISYGAYPVKLKTADKTAVAQTIRILRNGEAVMIFPEGVRSPDGQLTPFEQGPARLAIQTNAALVPVTILGAYESWPSKHAFPRLFKPINIKYHAPIYPDDFPADMNSKEKAEAMNQKMAKVISRRLRAWRKLRS